MENNLKIRSKFLILILLYCFVSSIYSQKYSNYKDIDKLISTIQDSLTKSTENIVEFINSNFKTQDEKIRAIYYWITEHIEYDIENMYAINFYQKPEESISKTLKTRKSICKGYTELFSSLCEKSGIESQIILGYNKMAGFNDYVSHSWVAAKIDINWYLFDPTWGAGYIFDQEFKKNKQTNILKSLRRN